MTAAGREADHLVVLDRRRERGVRRHGEDRRVEQLIARTDPDVGERVVVAAVVPVALREVLTDLALPFGGEERQRRVDREVLDRYVFDAQRRHVVTRGRIGDRRIRVFVRILDDQVVRNVGVPEIDGEAFRITYPRTLRVCGTAQDHHERDDCGAKTPTLKLQHV